MCPDKSYAHSLACFAEIFTSTVPISAVAMATAAETAFASVYPAEPSQTAQAEFIVWF